MRTIQSFALILFLPSALGAATLTNLWNFESPDPFNDKLGTAHGTAGSSITTTTGFNGGTAAVFPASVGPSAHYVDIAESGITSLLGGLGLLTLLRRRR